LKSTACSGNESEIVSLYKPENSHISKAGYSPYHVCTYIENYTVICSIKSSCDENETCVISMYNETNSHAASCDYYPYKLCCKKVIPRAYITMYLNSTRLWWGDGLKVYGKAVGLDGNPIPNKQVTVKINNVIKTDSTTNANGEYNAEFAAPLTLGTYNISVEITDPNTNMLIFNSTLFKIVIFYGGEESEGRDVSCVKFPTLVLNKRGLIQLAYLRICVWK